MDDTFEESSQESAVDQVVAQIRELIDTDGLTVGDKLPTERELCERFAISRNTVREAMRMLKAYGIVDVRPKVGATIIDERMNRALDIFSFNVGEISRRTFDDIQGFRELIETGTALAIFDAVTPNDMEELRALNHRMVQARSIVEASEFDFEFHIKLISLTGNRSILDVYGIMKPVILRIMQHGKTRRIIEGETFQEHEGVLRAIEATDHLAYQYLMRTHLRKGLATFPELGPIPEKRS
ncbi:transcriptional regulator, GntR family [Pseudooceanicola antarcticus]|uniref:Transcriptional regulator, GntR family n=1 Tax=Pseudooceanicola antarcticus TaxID=1247613 RepID=A0A285JE87_9RHOB|nr:GntR family transcriptional regulator [Pseudooceanicola antarcticus]SNY58582.1 transcriptional regulator, GntR family [Pseudooceanicola antarcticus]